MKEIIIFDICDTLYKCNTTFAFLDYFFSKKNSYKILSGIRKNIFYRLLNKILISLFNIDLTRKIFLLYLKGKTKNELNEMMEIFYNDFLYKKKILDTLKLLNEFKKQKRKIVLVSASCDFIVKIISKKLDINDFLSTELEYLDNKCVGKIKKDILKIKKEVVLEKYGNCKIITVTDNIDDYNLVSISEEAYIKVNKKNQKFWMKKNQNKTNKIYFIND